MACRKLFLGCANVTGTVRKRHSSCLSAGISWRRDQEDDRGKSQLPITRHYHTTHRLDILPLVGAVLIGGIGYVAYRKASGNSVLPQDAKQAQDAFRVNKASREGLRHYEPKPKIQISEEETKPTGTGSRTT